MLNYIYSRFVEYRNEGIVLETNDYKSKLRVGLCDDEDCTHNIVEELLAEYRKENRIDLRIFHFFDANQLLLKNIDLDFLLLDIDMPHMDGIEAAFEIRKRQFSYKIIMLTAMVDRFKEAFEIDAFRFVTKPIERGELFRAIDDVRKRLIGNDRITVYKDGIPFDISEKNVVFLAANGSASVIYTQKSEYRSEKSLALWEKELDERLFFRCHKSFIVNLQMIEKIERNTIMLKGGDKASVSRRKYKTFLETYMDFDVGSW